jgi:hypothetical protein
MAVRAPVGARLCEPQRFDPSGGTTCSIASSPAKLLRAAGSPPGLDTPLMTLPPIANRPERGVYGASSFGSPQVNRFVSARSDAEAA